MFLILPITRISVSIRRLFILLRMMLFASLLRRLKFLVENFVVKEFAETLDCLLLEILCVANAISSERSPLIANFVRRIGEFNII